MLNCLFFRIFSSVRMKWVWASARYLAFGRTPEHRRLAKCDAGSSRTGGFFLPRRGILCVRLAYCACIFSALPARRRNVGFCTAAAHTLAVGAENRTQRRHAPHGAVRALATPAGSIGTIFSTVGRSAPSTLFRQMRRSPLLFRNDTKIPFFLERQRFSGFDARSCSVSSPRFRQGRSFPTTLLQGR